MLPQSQVGYGNKFTPESISQKNSSGSNQLVVVSRIYEGGRLWHDIGPSINIDKTATSGYWTHPYSYSDWYLVGSFYPVMKIKDMW